MFSDPLCRYIRPAVGSGFKNLLMHNCQTALFSAQSITNPFLLMFRKHPFKISATLTFIKNPKRTYFHFGMNSLKRNIANRITKFFNFRLLQLYWAVVVLQHECRNEITYCSSNSNPTLTPSQSNHPPLFFSRSATATQWYQ